eukprot:159970_1
MIVKSTDLNIMSVIFLAISLVAFVRGQIQQNPLESDCGSAPTPGTIWSDKHYKIGNISQYNVNPAPFIVDALDTLKKDGYLQGNELIMDAGCGQGRNTLYILKQGFGALPVDASKSALALTDKLLNQNGYNSVKMIQSELQDLSQIDNEVVDAIICVTVLTHIFDSDVVLNEFHRVLKPNGVIIADVATVRDSTYNEISSNVGKVDGTMRLGKNVFLEEGTNIRYFEDAGDVNAIFHKFKTIYPTVEISFDEPRHTNSRPHQHTHSSFLVIVKKGD